MFNIVVESSSSLYPEELTHPEVAACNISD